MSVRIYYILWIIMDDNKLPYHRVDMYVSVSRLEYCGSTDLQIYMGTTYWSTIFVHAISLSMQMHWNYFDIDACNIMHVLYTYGYPWLPISMFLYRWLSQRNCKVLDSQRVACFPPAIPGLPEGREAAGCCMLPASANQQLSIEFSILYCSAVSSMMLVLDA